MPTLLERFQLASLPVTTATESGAISSGPMTLTQIQTFLDIQLEHFNPVAYAKLVNDRQRVAAIGPFLVSSGLVGLNVAAINSNVQRDALLKAICYSIGLCDASGVIISQSPP